MYPCLSGHCSSIDVILPNMVVTLLLMIALLVNVQSRVGPVEWLKPYTDETLKALPAEGVRSVHVYCPGFASDCLETIEEIGVENRDYFLQAGGERFGYIPALNDQVEHIDALEQLVRTQISDWLSREPEEFIGLRQERAREAGAEQ